MLAHKFPDPYVDILKHFASAEYADAEKRGDVSETIDKTIGKKCVALRGKTAAANYLALPKPGSTGLGVRGAYLYLELCLLPGAAFTLHFDLLTDAKFVARVTLSSRYTSIKQVGTVVQLPGAALAVTAGRWTVLGVDLAALTAAVVEPSKGQYSSLKGLMACCSMNLRAAFTSDIVYTPETLPRDFVFPLGRHAWADTFAWRWLPGPPASTTLSASELAVSGAALAQKEPPPQASVSPRTHPAGAKGSDEVQAARRRRQRSGAAPRALFPPPPKATAPADPTLLELSRVLGYSGERSGLLVWMKDGRRVLYAAAAILILQDIDTGAQRFLIGHTADVCTLSAAQTKPVIASAQLGTVPIIRLWDSEACTPLAILQQHASDMHTLSLSADGALLAAVGKDRRGRQLLAVWDVSEADAPIPSCPLLDAKVSQTHIRVIQWVPPDPMDIANQKAEGEPPLEGHQLLSCGYENVRFWRLRRGRLHCCGMPLQHEANNLFLCMALDTPIQHGGGAERQTQRRLLIGSSSGHLFVIDPRTRTLEAVHALHEGAIHAVHLSAGFAVTGGEDRLLRVWPLDFSAHFLETEHEGSVTAIDASPDGLKLLIGTASGTIGMLDVPTLKHATVVRSHTDIIYGLAVDPHNREFVTAGCDGSLRVWELDGTQAQLVEFELPEGCSRCVAYHPTEYAIAAGFDDGSVRIFDIASTSLLEEYTQHAGVVVDILYSHDAERLFSASTDCGLCAYDVLHGYQPSRAFAATKFEGASPSIALTSDDALLVAGGLQQHALLTLDAATLTVLHSFSLSTNAAAVAIGPSRTLFVSTTEGTLITLALSASGQAAGEAAVTPGGHKAAVDALTLSRNGRHVATGGQDRLLKLWPVESLREGGTAYTSGAGAGACQGYVGHSDHITRLAFSSDGQTLLSVGGGDAIFVWEFKGPAGADAAEVVEESVRQAEAERSEQMGELQRRHERTLDTLPTPAMVMNGVPEEGEDEEDEENEQAAGLAAAPVAGGPTDADFEALRQRLRRLGTAEAGFMMAGAEAAMDAATKSVSGQAGKATDLLSAAAAAATAAAEEAEEDEEEEGEEEEEEEEEEAGPRKRYRARVVYSEEAPSDEGAVAGAPDEREVAARLSSDPSNAMGGGAAGGAAAAEEEASPSLAAECAAGLTLRRLIGFSTHAHDHVLWHPPTATLVYASGDTLIVDGLAPGSAPVHLTGGSGEISTLALSSDGRFAAVGSGGDSPLCVYDLQPRAADLDVAASAQAAATAAPSAVLRMRLPGHEGGVQCLAFLGQAALASLGLQDCQLRVYSVVSGALMLSAVTPPEMHTLSVSADGLQISAAGKGGLHTWRVSTAAGEGGGSSRPALLPLPPRALSGCYDDDDDDEEAEPVHATSLVQLTPSLSLTGDSTGTLALWGPASSPSSALPPATAAPPLGIFGLSSLFDEIDLLHAAEVVTPVSPSDIATWHLVLGGASESHAVCRFRLTLPPATAMTSADSSAELVLTPLGTIELDGDAIAMSWAADGEQGVVGTAAGSLWHVEWASGAATLLTGAVPPPLVTLAVPRSFDGRAPSVLASLSLGDMQADSCGVLLWDANADGACAAPLARIHQPNEPATCVAVTPGSSPAAHGATLEGDPTVAGLVAVGYSAGRVQLVSVGSLKLLAQRRVHVAAVACIAFGPRSCLLTAAADGEVRLHSAMLGELLAPLATLRPPTNVPVTCLDMSYGGYVISDMHVASSASSSPPAPVALWAVASEHQQVEVWPLVRDARSAAEATPLVSLSLETAPLLKLPAKLAPLGWKCLVSFLPGRPGVIACTGLTRNRRLTLYDFLQRQPLAALALDEWPTSLAACDVAPLLAVGGASGAVQLVEYLQAPTTAEEAAEEAAHLEAGGSVLRGAASVELHCHNVRSLAFGGECLYSAAEDEVATWELPM